MRVIDDKIPSVWYRRRAGHLLILSVDGDEAIAVCDCSEQVTIPMTDVRSGQATHCGNQDVASVARRRVPMIDQSNIDPVVGQPVPVSGTSTSTDANAETVQMQAPTGTQGAQPIRHQFRRSSQLSSRLRSITSSEMFLQLSQAGLSSPCEMHREVRSRMLVGASKRGKPG